MKKRTTLIILFVLLFVYLLIVAGYFWPRIDGHVVVIYPHDNIVQFLNVIALIVPIIVLLICIIRTILSKDFVKISNNIITLVVVFVILIPICLKITSVSISNYDKNHYEGEKTDIFGDWHNIEDK